MGESIYGAIGLYGGALMGFFGWWLGRYFARKEFQERDARSG